jgi:hypothetical protein
LKDESYLRIVTEGDRLYELFKFDRKSNYKSNLENSLGVFEHPMTFSVVHQVLTTLSILTSSSKDLPLVQTSIEDLKVKSDIWAKTLVEIEI